MIVKQAFKLAISGMALVIIVAAHGQQGKWAATGDPTAKSLVDWERQWAEAACTGRVIVQTILADDFQGTFPMENAIPSRKQSQRRKPRRLRPASVA